MSAFTEYCLQPSARKQPSFVKDTTDLLNRWPAQGCVKCDNTKRDLCRNFLVNSKTFSSARTGKIYVIRQTFLCSSTNVIYLVHCKECNLPYVELATTEFEIRVVREVSPGQKSSNRFLKVVKPVLSRNSGTTPTS